MVANGQPKTPKKTEELQFEVGDIAFNEIFAVTRKKIGTKCFCRNYKKVNAKNFLEADDINKKLSRDGFKYLLNVTVRDGTKFILHKTPQVVQFRQFFALLLVTEHLSFVFNDIQVR